MNTKINTTKEFEFSEYPINISVQYSNNDLQKIIIHKQGAWMYLKDKSEIDLLIKLLEHTKECIEEEEF